MTRRKQRRRQTPDRYGGLTDPVARAQQPAPEQQQQPASAAGDLEALRSVTQRLELLATTTEQQRARRDELVARLRAQGVTWAQLEAETGTSRQGLHKRQPMH